MPFINDHKYSLKIIVTALVFHPKHLLWKVEKGGHGQKYDLQVSFTMKIEEFCVCKI